LVAKRHDYLDLGPVWLKQKVRRRRRSNAQPDGFMDMKVSETPLLTASANPAAPRRADFGPKTPERAGF
jgi:hypothetical protein